MENDESSVVDVLSQFLSRLDAGRTVLVSKEGFDTSKRGLVKAATAARWLDVSREYVIEVLIKKNIVEGRLVEGRWFVTTRSLNRLVDGRKRG
ncbi:hypothetical protein B9G54_01650 [Alloscardovia macacae]|uniref:Helix-turn-helix domain-containing protein n=1 Tax=Alloscardovia macacae TaxID=1160091 RepID=A0A1Y2SYX5_9BIFI|nr:hypothetical protein [Alloscardovia macacae]OTA27250.1 hypothetical protein B9G54_01650 [Alloscardovia macacae]OTA29260.1 hypothetical protein B9T39_03845 [Alloscardovia macacae]